MRFNLYAVEQLQPVVADARGGTVITVYGTGMGTSTLARSPGGWAVGPAPGGGAEGGVWVDGLLSKEIDAG